MGANLAAVQANLTLRKAGGMKQTKVSAADPCGQAADPGGNSMVAKDVCELRDASARSVVANLAAVQANLTLRKAGGMKQTKVSAVRSVVANLAAVQATSTH